MISIRKYLDGTAEAPEDEAAPVRAAANGARGREGEVLRASLKAYSSALAEMGRSGVDVCPAEGPALENRLGEIANGIGERPSIEAIVKADSGVQTELREWGRRAARHYRAKAGEVKEILLAMAQTTESVGQRDAHYAQQIGEMTRKLSRIACLDDITTIRMSIQDSAAELKQSIERMAAEGRAVLERMQAQVTTFQAKLEEAEQVASIDALTRLRSRMWVEGQLEQRIATGTAFCTAIVDIDAFKSVNDQHGHLAGDALLKQFAEELKSACRASDVVGRWGGDEFLIVLDGERSAAEAQLERVRKWVCGQYTVETGAGAVKLNVEASIGLAEWTRSESLAQLLERADAAMYACKGAGRDRRSAAR
ncbi:MAG: GGDEF domain-containing protein [Acidobacteriota bacterium]